MYIVTFKCHRSLKLTVSSFCNKFSKQVHDHYIWRLQVLKVRVLTSKTLFGASHPLYTKNNKKSQSKLGVTYGKAKWHMERKDQQKASVKATKKRSNSWIKVIEKDILDIQLNKLMLIITLSGGLAAKSGSLLLVVKTSPILTSWRNLSTLPTQMNDKQFC